MVYTHTLGRPKEDKRRAIDIIPIFLPDQVWFSHASCTPSLYGNPCSICRYVHHIYNISLHLLERLSSWIWMDRSGGRIRHCFGLDKVVHFLYLLLIIDKEAHVLFLICYCSMIHNLCAYIWWSNISFMYAHWIIYHVYASVNWLADLLVLEKAEGLDPTGTS